MKPTARQLCDASVELELAARELQGRQDTRRAESCVVVAKWLDVEMGRLAAREAQRCTAGRAHRVRDVEDQGDGITVEQCRCGARRVRDARAVGDEVTDWRRTWPAEGPPLRRF